MVIEKSKMFPGRYVARQMVNGDLVIGTGRSHTEALEDIFELLRWRDVGNKLGINNNGDVEPIKGLCYHIDCDDNRCRCWDDPELLKREVNKGRIFARKVFENFTRTDDGCCEKCGGELFSKMVGDENYGWCSECNWITHK